jgi:hypothetical protein
MTWRRRPIPKRLYPGLAAAKGPSLRYELVCNGAVRKYPDGREVCEDSLAGRREYLRRLEAMLNRQGGRCCLCARRIYSLQDATFEHQRRRGMASAWRDDRILSPEGQWINGAAHWTCNYERG